MSSSVEIHGREFDWFALDTSGAVAIFATAGFGPAPESVLRCAAAHDAVSEKIPVRGFGTIQVWQSYSAAGIFAYDWNDSEGTYHQVASPDAPLLQSVSELVVQMSLPVFARSFALSPELGIGDLLHGT